MLSERVRSGLAAARARGRKLGRQTGDRPKSDRLAPRVLALVAEGRSNTEIAAALFVSVATVKTHINSLFAKLQVRDRAQVIALARS